MPSRGFAIALTAPAALPKHLWTVVPCSIRAGPQFRPPCSGSLLSRKLGFLLTLGPWALLRLHCPGCWYTCPLCVLRYGLRKWHVPGAITGGGFKGGG